MGTLGRNRIGWKATEALRRPTPGKGAQDYTPEGPRTMRDAGQAVATPLLRIAPLKEPEPLLPLWKAVSNGQGG